MIKRIFSGIDELCGSGFCGEKISFFHRAYGTGYDFCRFCSTDGGVLLVYNSNVVIDSVPDDETEEFIGMISPYTVESAYECELSGMKKIPCRFMTKKLRKNEIYCPDEEYHVIKNGKFDKAFEVLSQCFEGIGHGEWYTHASHCVRRGMTDVFLIEGTASARTDYFGDVGYSSDVCTVPAMRGKGFCRRIISAAEKNAYEKCGTAAVCCFDENVPLYAHLGYEIADSVFYYVKKNN